MIRAVLLDMDGTLVDSLRDLAGCVNAVLALFDIAPRPVECFRRYAGSGTKEMIRRALGDETPPRDAEDLLALYTERYRVHCLDETRAYPGMPEALAALRADGVRLGIVTNKPQDIAETIANRLFPGLFDTVQGQREPYPTKPDPALANLAADALGAAPDECILVGDSEVDVRTAHAFGAQAVGALWGFRGQDELELAGADFLIASPGALPPAVRARNRRR